jgi:hypothetical protein
MRHELRSWGCLQPFITFTITTIPYASPSSLKSWGLLEVAFI